MVRVCGLLAQNIGTCHLAKENLSSSSENHALPLNHRMKPLGLSSTTSLCLSLNIFGQKTLSWYKHQCWYGHMASAFDL